MMFMTQEVNEKSLKKPTQEEWIECHQLFLQYMNKVASLMQK